MFRPNPQLAVLNRAHASVATLAVVLLFVQSASAQAAPAAPQTTTEKAAMKESTFGKWVVSCPTGAVSDTDKRSSCWATLRIMDPARGKLAFVWDIRVGEDGKLRSLIQTPTGVQLRSGVELRISRFKRTFKFENCSPQSCEALGSADEDLIDRMNRAKRAVMSVHAGDGQVLTFDAPVQRIAKAVAALGF